MNITKNKGNIIILAIIIVIILLALIWWNQSEEVTDKKVIKKTTGITNQECDLNADCQNVCGDDKCLVPSCTKQVDSSIGKCSCLGICN